MTNLRCPSGLVVEMRTLFGKDIRSIAAAEKAKTNQKRLEAFADVIRGTTTAVLDPGPFAWATTPGFDWKRLPIGDTMVGLLQLRISTYGEDHEISYECRCEHKGKFTVNLTTFPIRPIPESSLRFMRNGGAPVEVTLSDGRKISFHLRTIAQEIYIEEQHKQMRRRPEWEFHTASYLDNLAAQLAYIEGLENSRNENVSGEFVKRLEWLLSMPAPYIHEIVDVLLEADGGLDTGFSYACQACGTEIGGDLPLVGFFTPPSRKKPEKMPGEPIAQPTPAATS